jgi:putative ABC transport system permease protein
MNGLLQDLRYALRQLRKNPGFTAVAVITLAVGIGAITAVFSVVDAVLLKPLAIVGPARIVYVREQWRDSAGGVSVGNFADTRQQSTSFSNLCASGSAGFNLSPLNEAPERVDGEAVTGDYFATFGVQPIIGRVFSAEEDKPGQAHVVVISEGLWRAKFHANPAIIGQALRVNGEPSTVIGVMPASFDPLLESSAMWVPAAFTAQQLANHDDHYLSVIGRLKPGVTLAKAQSELDVIARRLQAQFPMDDKDRGLRATPLTTALLGDERLTFQLLSASVGFLLLIACANIANLQLSRGRVRTKEIAVRAAVGASAARIVRQLLLENLLLAVAAGAVGVALAYAGVAWIVAKGPAGVPRLAQSSVDATALAFSCAVVLLSSLLFGLAPALRSASPRLSEVFKTGFGGSISSRDRVQSALVVGEIALALLLMTGAGLLIRTSLVVLHLDPGFDTANLVVGRIGLPDAGYGNPDMARQTFERIIDASAALPEIESAAIVSRAPLGEGWSGNGLIAEGRPIDPSSLISALSQFVSPSYLSTARIQLQAGRDFSAQDTRNKVLVAIVNETLARTMWPGENPIGKRFACCEEGPKGRTDPVWHEVVGVVRDVRARGLDVDVQPVFYLPLAQMPPAAWDWLGRTMDLVVRTRSGAFPANDLRSAVASIATGVPIYQLSSMKEKIAGSLEESHFDTFLLSLFGGIALLLASVGIYGVLSHVFAQRTRDIGVRMALGATRGEIAWHVLASGLRLIVVGIAIGLACALACSHLLAALLYGVRSNDAMTLTIAPLILAFCALLASYVPARRAMRVDPMVALRYE